MMELALRDGDYVPDYAGGLQRATGREALLQRVLFRLTARRGTFPFREDLGSRLWQLGQVAASARQAAANQSVAEALAEETELTVEEVTLVQQETGAELTAELSYEGETLSVTVELQM
jgi:phage baseplate assembly protein W